jgi:hypothetical protein
MLFFQNVLFFSEPHVRVDFYIFKTQRPLTDRSLSLDPITRRPVDRINPGFAGHKKPEKQSEMIESLASEVSERWLAGSIVMSGPCGDLGFRGS